MESSSCTASSESGTGFWRRFLVNHFLRSGLASTLSLVWMESIRWLTREAEESMDCVRAFQRES